LLARTHFEIAVWRASHRFGTVHAAVSITPTAAAIRTVTTRRQARRTSKSRTSSNRETSTNGTPTAVVMLCVPTSNADETVTNTRLTRSDRSGLLVVRYRATLPTNSATIDTATSSVHAPRP